MSYERERGHLEEILQVPITRVELKGFDCTIYFENEIVGHLPVALSEDGIHYEGVSFTESMDWPKLFDLNYDAINAIVSRQVRTRKFIIVPRAWRRLFIEDESGNLFASFQCSFRDGRWSVTNEKILV